jgi:hypothetical protein
MKNVTVARGSRRIRRRVALRSRGDSTFEVLGADSVRGDRSRKSPRIRIQHSNGVNESIG